MLKTLLVQVKEFKLPSILTPACMIGEVICEMIIPVLMGRIVDLGIGGSDMQYIVRTGLFMLVVVYSLRLKNGHHLSLRFFKVYHFILYIQLDI